MSGPNTNYDPVEVAALDPAMIDAAVSAAEVAVRAAATLPDLKAARAGDKSPLAMANREIGALPPSAKAEAGKRIGEARGRVNAAFALRQTELEAERDARILVEEAVDVTLPTGRRPLGRRHPIELMSERIADLFVGMGWEIAEGPEVEAEWFNFDALNFDADHPARQMQDTFYVEPPEGGLILRTHTSPVQARALLERGARCDPHAGLPSGGGTLRRRGHHHGAPQGDAGHLGLRTLRRGHHDPPAPVLLPFHRAQRRDGPALLRLPR